MDGVSIMVLLDVYGLGFWLRAEDPGSQLRDLGRSSSCFKLKSGFTERGQPIIDLERFNEFGQELLNQCLTIDDGLWMAT